MKPYIQFYPSVRRSKRYRHAVVMVTIITVSGLISAGVVWRVCQFFKP